MASINIDLDYFAHPKIMRLVLRLGRGAELLPLRLWCYCGKYHYVDGRMEGYSEAEIERIAQWWGKAGEMVKEMLELKLLNKCENYFEIHDWKEFQKHLHIYKVRSAKMNKIRWKNQQKKELPVRTPARNPRGTPNAVLCNAVQGKAVNSVGSSCGSMEIVVDVASNPKKATSTDSLRSLKPNAKDKGGGLRDCHGQVRIDNVQAISALVSTALKGKVIL